MELLALHTLSSSSTRLLLSSNRFHFPLPTVSQLLLRCNDRKSRVGNKTSYHPITISGRRRRSSFIRTSNKGFMVCAAKSESDIELSSSGNMPDINVHVDASAAEPFRGKSGSISFYGLTHQLVEETKLESAPFKENSGSILWVLAPVALISSLVLPQFLLINTIDSIARDEILAEILISLSSEVTFYIGLMLFFNVTNHVQKPYLQFSSKRWGLITGLKGYLSSAFLITGLKVMAPIFAVYVTWPIIGLPALVAVAPFLVGLVAQFVFEAGLDKSGSSAWPLVPIIFEVYRLYQLSKAANFLERLMHGMKDALSTPQVMERSGAMVALLITFQALGLVCLWSLTTFLLRLFPSRPVSQKY